ncbi:bifunctional DedA family/phosphatase PAP2 family protein [soil metagenome]
MEYIQPYLTYFSDHPVWAIAILFLIAFGEALLIIGLFVPSTAVLVGGGMLVGTGHLSFWPVFAAIAVGAVAGDQVSYWAGRLFGQRLKTLWPLSNYPGLVERGEDFVRQHGGKSIAIGRFVPGVKAVVPGIVGMFGMGQLYFASINIASGIVWTACHVFPGILLGQGLAMAGELSGRLVIVLLVLLTLLAVAGWLIRLAIGGLGPYFDRAQHALSAWACRRPERWARVLGGVISPDHPGSAAIIIFSFVAVTAFISFLSLLSKLFGGSTLAEADVSVHNMMQSLRNAPGDEIMTMITMFGDWEVMLLLALAMVLWLIWRGAWRVSLALALTVLSARLFVPIMKIGLQRARPLDVHGLLETFSFPSGHTTFATVTFGVLAVLASQGLRTWGRALVFATAGIAVIAIAYSRIYLGAHWFTDVVGGFLFGTVMIAAFGIAVEAVPSRRIMPFGLTVCALAVFLVAGTANIASNYDANAALYEPREAIVLYDRTQWLAGGWASVGLRRVDLVGKRDEPLMVQWVGDLAPLESGLTQLGWTKRVSWSWRQVLPYLDPTRSLNDLEPRPALHRGRKAVLTWTLPANDNAAQRLVLRAWKTDFAIAKEGDTQPLYVINLVRERLRKGLSLYAVPSPIPAAAGDDEPVLSMIRAMPQEVVLHGTGLSPKELPLLVDSRS